MTDDRPHVGTIKIEDVSYDLGLFDVQMPGLDGLSLLEKAQQIRPEMATVIFTGAANMETAIRALRLGAADFLPKPITLPELEAVLEKAVRVRELRRDKYRLRDTIGGIQRSNDLRERSRTFVGTSSATQLVHAQVREIVEAQCDSVLITGETGTGKEVVARQIHFEAGPEESPFIAVSCPALPDSLVESELFGHVKGSFTGATTDRRGYFELADGGTLFLDEVGDLSSSAQAVLLRVLETRSFRRVGGSKEITVQLRVVAATNADLEEDVRAGKFRGDLFHRFNVYPVYLSPLRERREDIIPLAEHFLSTYAETRGLPCRDFSEEAKEMLVEYDFPGNARELRNLVERAMILSRSSDRILSEHLSLLSRRGSKPVAKTGATAGDAEADRILNALEEAKWNRRKAAQNLGMPYSTLRYKMGKFQIGRD